MKKRNLKKVFARIFGVLGMFLLGVTALVVAPKVSDYIDQLAEETPTVEVEDDATTDENPEVETEAPESAE